MLDDTIVKQEIDETVVKPTRLKRPVRNIKPKEEPIDDEEGEAEDDDEDFSLETEAQPARKKRRIYVDKDKIQYARELIDNKLSNKEMSMLLEMSIACVRKLKMKILNGTVDELIDNSEEHYTKVEKSREAINTSDNDTEGNYNHVFK